jgi:pilus assembly protein Flp/PilA
MDKFVMKMYVALHTGLYSLREKADRERGATAVEYGLLVALIAAVIVATVVLLGNQINNAFKTVSDQL